MGFACTQQAFCHGAIVVLIFAFYSEGPPKLLRLALDLLCILGGLGTCHFSASILNTWDYGPVPIDLNIGVLLYPLKLENPI